MSCGPPKFEGSDSPTVVMQWLREIDQVFDSCDCEPEHRVKYVVRMLKGRALLWWDTVVAAIDRAEIDRMSWSDFSARVQKKYCSEYDLHKIEQEFLQLKKGDGTVEELITGFTDRMRFVTALVPDERAKIRRFVRCCLLVTGQL